MIFYFAAILIVKKLKLMLSSEHYIVVIKSDVSVIFMLSVVVRNPYRDIRIK